MSLLLLANVNLLIELHLTAEDRKPLGKGRPHATLAAGVGTWGFSECVPLETGRTYADAYKSTGLRKEARSEVPVRPE